MPKKVKTSEILNETAPDQKKLFQASDNKRNIGDPQAKYQNLTQFEYLPHLKSATNASKSSRKPQDSGLEVKQLKRWICKSEKEKVERMWVHHHRPQDDKVTTGRGTMTFLRCEPELGTVSMRWDMRNGGSPT